VTIAILGTLPFIATLWLLVAIGAAMVEESGAKIAAALKGKTLSEAVPTTAQRVRIRPKERSATSAIVPLRAAA